MTQGKWVGSRPADPPANAPMHLIHFDYIDQPGSWAGVAVQISLGVSEDYLRGAIAMGEVMLHRMDPKGDLSRGNNYTGSGK